MYHICDNYAYTYTHIHARDPSAHLKQASFPCPTCYYSIVCLNACPVSLLPTPTPRASWVLDPSPRRASRATRVWAWGHHPHRAIEPKEWRVPNNRAEQPWPTSSSQADRTGSRKLAKPVSAGWGEDAHAACRLASGAPCLQLGHGPAGPAFQTGVEGGAGEGRVLWRSWCSPLHCSLQMQGRRTTNPA